MAIAKGDMFAQPAYVQSYLEGVFEQLPGENHLRGLQRDWFVDRLAHYLAEINATHPFRDGNGRAQRAFVGQVANDAGYAIGWTRLDPERNIEVSVAAHRAATRRCGRCSPSWSASGSSITSKTSARPRCRRRPAAPRNPDPRHARPRRV